MKDRISLTEEGQNTNLASLSPISSRNSEHSLEMNHLSKMNAFGIMHGRTTMVTHSENDESDRSSSCSVPGSDQESKLRKKLNTIRFRNASVENVNNRTVGSGVRLEADIASTPFDMLGEKK